MGTRGEPGSEPLVSGRGVSASGWGDEEREQGEEEDGDELDGVEVVKLGERRAREEEGAAMRDDEVSENKNDLTLATHLVFMFATHFA